MFEDRASIDRSNAGPFWMLLFGMFILIGAFLLIAEHRAHLLGALPYFLALAALLLSLIKPCRVGRPIRPRHRS